MATLLEDLDVSRGVYTSLGIKRFLTLNYDLEIERMLLEETRSSPEQPFGTFKEFVDYAGIRDERQSVEIFKDKEFTPGQAITLSSASGKVVRSTSSRPETLADLFSFGAFPTNFDASVHHLHGRLDDPENMIVTPDDYQKIYYGKSEQIKSFDEARHAVFTGSDLLVFGMGHSETEILKPLRDLLEINSNRLDSHGKVYYLALSKTAGDWSFENAYKKASCANKALSQKLLQTYNMYTLYIDFSFQGPSEEPFKSSAWNHYLSSIFFVRAEFAYYLNCFKENENAVPKLWDGTQNTQYKMRFNQTWEKPAPEDDYYYEERTKIFAAQQLVRQILKNCNNITETTDKNESISKVKDFIELANEEILNLALATFTRSLRESRSQWWDKWSDTPGLRLAVYGTHFYRFSGGKRQLKCDSSQSTNTSNEKLVWKQTNLVCFYDKPESLLQDAESSPQFTSFIQVTKKAAEEKKAWLDKKNTAWKKRQKRNQKSNLPAPTKHPSVIARICIPSGNGKGRLVSFFTNKQNVNGAEIFPFTYLFNAKHRKVNYIGAFSVQLTFALEFSSLVIGVGRFIQNALCELRQSAVGGTDEEWDHFIGYEFHKTGKIPPAIEHLKELFSFLQLVFPKQGWSDRILLIISDLDKVVDEFGDAYSPIHRAFFRLISGWNDEEAHSKLPIDFIFIASRSDQPIRYLSIEKKFLKKECRLDSKWRESQWIIRKERNCALRTWEEIEKLKPHLMIEEALLYALLCNAPDENKGLYCVSTHHSLTATPEGIKWAKGERNDMLKAINAGGISLFGLIETLPEGLRQFLNRRTVHAYITSSLVVELWRMAGEEHPEKSEKNRAFRRYWNLYTNSLSAAYTKDRVVGYFEELFRSYANIYRKRANLKKPKQAFKWRRRESEDCIVIERLRAVIVDHLALFAHPISVSVLEMCPEIKIAAHSYKKDRKDKIPNAVIIGRVMNEMANNGLAARNWKYSKLCAIDKPVSKKKLSECIDDFVFTLDPEIISVVRAKNGLSKHNASTIIPHQSSLYTSQLEHSVKPDMHHFERIGQVVRALLQTPHRELVGYQNQDKKQWDDFDEAKKIKILNNCSEKFRSAYALIRGTFSLAVLSRLDYTSENTLGHPPFDEYRTWIRKCLNSATLLTKVIENSKTNLNPKPLVFNEPFFRDEVAWLYNERALVSFIQGRLFDALPLYDQGLRVIGRDFHAHHSVSSHSQYRRIRLNQALSQIERGHLGMARSVLESIIRATVPRWKGETPSTTNAYATGYLALCHHLSGDFTSAESMYVDVIERLKKEGHIRGQSIFRRHYADLLRSMAKSRDDEIFLEATHQLRTAEELAMGIRAVDLQNYALIAKARLERDKANRESALENLRHAEKYARRITSVPTLNRINSIA